jgi:hypothetical protein
MKKGILCLVLLVLTFKLYAASRILDTNFNQRLSILNLISNLQLNNPSDGLYGSFPSYRKYYFSSKQTQEDNIFFTSLVLFNIGQFRNLMIPQEVAIIDKAKANALIYIERFKNQNNQLTYNFWPRNPPQIFPNGGWLNQFNNKLAIADDIDVGSIALLALGLNDSVAKAMQSKFGTYRVGLIKPNRSFYRQYKDRPVYSTWLGTRTPKDVDLSVLTNVLLMHTIANIPLNATDSASLDLIVDLVKTNKHLTDPKLVSQHYAYSATIIYHIARLVYFSNYPSLLALKPILLNQAFILSKESKFPLEQLLLNTSILRLGGKIDLPLSVNEVSLIGNDYPYFVANIACILNNPFKRIVNRSNFVRFDYYSYAFNLSLLYENLMLRGD